MGRNVFISLHNDETTSLAVAKTILEQHGGRVFHSGLPGRPSAGKGGKKIFINPAEDPDDFFLTTNATLCKKLAGRGFNTIFQDNKFCSDNGSLSSYCGMRDIRYVNCEKEHGKYGQYTGMINTFSV